jgi:L-lactate dehydrogenase complex protein LldF
MSKVIPIQAAKDFKARSKAVLDNEGQRKNFRGAMDFLQAKRRSQFSDEDELQGLRNLGQAIRQYSLANLPRLLTQLEANLTANGVTVHWAENADDANAIALDIARRVNARHIIKGKSMVSEEIGFNHAMEAAGIEALESDMGEYIVQLAGEGPSHIIMPAIHKTKQEIAQLFADEVPGVAYTEDVDALIQIGRRVMRRKFADADIGLSGVNFAWPKPARCAWWRTRVTGACAPRCPRCTLPSPALKRWWKSWTTCRRC